MEGKEVKKLSIGMAMQSDGKVLCTTHTASGTKKIFVVPGKYATIETTHQEKTLVSEVLLGPLGWEYEQ